MSFVLGIIDKNKELYDLLDDNRLKKYYFSNFKELKDFKENLDICIVNPTIDSQITEHLIKEKVVVLLMLEKLEFVENIIDGLSKGAFDYFPKRIISLLGEIEKENYKKELLEKLELGTKSKEKIFSDIKVGLEGNYDFTRSSNKLIIFGSSTGGPQTLEKIIPLIPKEVPCPVIVIQHMPKEFTDKLAQRLNNISSLTVKEAEDGEELHNGFCYIAKGDYHLELIKKQGKIIISLNQKEKIHGTRPCVDVTMESATKYYGKNIIGTILTGMGSDGTIGAKKIKEAGGTIIAQSEKTSVIYGMPKSVVTSGFYDEILDLEKIPVAVVQMLEVEL